MNHQSSYEAKFCHTDADLVLADEFSIERKKKKEAGKKEEQSEAVKRTEKK